MQYSYGLLCLAAVHNSFLPNHTECLEKHFLGETMKKILSNKKAIALYIVPTIIIMLVIVIVPIFISVYYSMLDWDGLGKGTFIGLQNYKELVADERFISSVKNSLLYVALSVFIQLPISLVLALIIANIKRGEKFYRTT